MNCHKVQSLASAYIDGELAGVEMLTVRRHLNECTDCSGEYESLLKMKRMFGGYGINFITLRSFPGCPEVVEDGKTFRANAVKKAIAVSKFTGCPAVADDSGLEVPALGGAPAWSNPFKIATALSGSPPSAMSFATSSIFSYV